MSKHGGARFLLIVIAILVALATSVPMVAESLSINLDVNGGIDAWLHGLEILASIQGEVALVGDVMCDEGIVWLSATGIITGAGFYSILELMTRGWILMAAAGQTNRGESIVLRSLLYAAWQNLIPLQVGDLFKGVHHTVIQIGEFLEVYWGEFAGTLEGGLAPAETEGTIQLAGSGNFHLLGEQVLEASPAIVPKNIPLDDPDLPAAFLQAIGEFFNLPFTQELQDI